MLDVRARLDLAYPYSPATGENELYAEYLDIPLAPVQYGVACLGMLACAYLVGALWRHVRSGSGR